MLVRLREDDLWCVHVLLFQRVRAAAARKGTRVCRATCGWFVIPSL